jgi:hypothetical protein
MNSFQRRIWPAACIATLAAAAGIIAAAPANAASLQEAFIAENNAAMVLVHGMGFSPDRKTIAVVSIGSNSVTVIAGGPGTQIFSPDGKYGYARSRT